MATPIRSLTEPPGLNISSLPKRRPPPAGDMRVSWTIGVRPTWSAMLIGIAPIAAPSLAAVCGTRRTPALRHPDALVEPHGVRVVGSDIELHLALGGGRGGGEHAAQELAAEALPGGVRVDREQRHVDDAVRPALREREAGGRVVALRHAAQREVGGGRAELALRPRCLGLRLVAADGLERGLMNGVQLSGIAGRDRSQAERLGIVRADVALHPPVTALILPAVGLEQRAGARAEMPDDLAQAAQPAFARSPPAHSSSWVPAPSPSRSGSTTASSSLSRKCA